MPKLSVTGHYKIDGRILVLPIRGDGDAKLTFINAKLSFNYKPNVIVKDGKEYIQTDRFKLDLDAEKMDLKLENLFNGDKALGDNMNLFLNENWRDIFNEMKPAVELSVIEILKGIVNRIYIKFPYEDAFLKD